MQMIIHQSQVSNATDLASRQDCLIMANRRPLAIVDPKLKSKTGVVYGAQNVPRTMIAIAVASILVCRHCRRAVWAKSQ